MNRTRLIVLVILLICCYGSIAQRYEKPRLSSPDSWTMILLPDPQTYNKFERNQPIFDLMTAWISEHIDSLNIGLVLCTGDLVEQNDWPHPDGVSGNQTGDAQWQSVARAFDRLDGKVPYITAVGNHDFGYKNIENRNSWFRHHFPVSKNILNQKILYQAAINAEGYPTLENAAYAFTAPNRKPYLILSLEFAPRDTIVEWAKKIIALPKFSKYTVIVLTHSFLNAQNEHIVKEKYPLSDGNYGAALFSILVRPSSTIQLVLSGHIGAPDNPQAHLGFRKDKNASGKTVNQMAFNAQALGGGWHGNGGDGWLRILEFLPDDKTVQVKTFSPLFAISPATRHLAWRTESYDQFSFTLD